MDFETFTSGTREKLVTSESADIGDVVEALKQIEMALSEIAARRSAAMSLWDAANYLGIGAETLEALAKVNPTLRPVSPTTGVRVWRRADLDAFIGALAQ